MQKFLQPPKTSKKPVITPYHGDSRVDEYSWLRKQENPKVIAHIKAENDYADALMKPTQRLQKELYTEIRKRMKENDMSVPVKEGPYEYYSRSKKGKQYMIHCRKRITGGKEQVVLDENKLAEGEKYFSLGLFETSPDHRLLAYATNTTGDEKHTLRIKDLRTGARQRVHACFFQFRQYVVMAHFFQLADMGYFGWSQRMELKSGI